MRIGSSFGGRGGSPRFSERVLSGVDLSGVDLSGVFL